MFAEPTGICLSFFGLLFCFFSLPVRYLMRCYLTGARGHQWGGRRGGSAVAVRTLHRDVFTLSALAAPSESQKPVALFCMSSAFLVVKIN